MPSLLKRNKNFRTSSSTENFSSLGDFVMADITSRFYACMGRSVSEEMSGLVAFNLGFSEFQTIASEIFQKLDSVNSGNVYEIQSEIEVLEDSIGDLGLVTDSSSMIHCKSIIDILYSKLRDTLSKIQQRDMVELRRQMNMSEYFKPKGVSGVVKWTQEVKLHASPVPPSASNQSVELEKEAEILLATYQTNMDEIVSVRSRIAETSALMSILSSKAIEQLDLADSILTLANDSVEYIEKADLQLNKAIQHNSSYRFYVVMWFMTLSLILLFLDFIK